MPILANGMLSRCNWYRNNLAFLYYHSEDCPGMYWYADKDAKKKSIIFNFSIAS